MVRFPRSLVLTTLAAYLGLLVAVAAQPINKPELIVLTTSTTQDSGILRVLTDAFAKKSGLAVKVIVAGSGDILKQGARGEGDVLLTHSPDAEQAWMAEGNGTSRSLVMYNEFVIIGPPRDPASIKGLRAADALKRIFQNKLPFVSRGDQSGTHVRELEMWKRAGVEPKGQSWYYETGQGQGHTMDVASQFRAYAFTDVGTYLVHAKRIRLPILVEKDPALYNIYHVMPANPAKFPKVNASGAKAFADWLVSAEGQGIIADFGRAQYSRSLFVPASSMREDELLRN